jgi:hypothetical protein
MAEADKDRSGEALVHMKKSLTLHTCTAVEMRILVHH